MGIHVGDTLILQFSDTSLLGAGVARAEGMAVFCPGVIGGDTAQVCITEVKRRYAHARLIEILTPSAHRCAPDCDVFGDCGGCLLRHMDYAEEARIKENAVRTALHRCDPDVIPEPIVTGESAQYRNKVVFHFGSGYRYGYYAAATHRLIYPKSGRCALHPALFDEIAAFTAVFLLRHAPDDPPVFSALGIRRAEDGSCTAVLYASQPCPAPSPIARRWAREVRDRFPCVSGAFFGSGAPAQSDTAITLLEGEAYLQDRFLSLGLHISPASFYQIHHDIAEKLCRTVAEYADLRPGERAADLYCGTGTIGLTLASLAPEAQLYGIEIIPEAVRDAQANAAYNHLQNIQFRCGDSATAEAEKQRYDCVVIDPPRKGCSPEMIDALKRLSPARIVYVSCNPATLARDLGVLTKAGWKLRRARPFDMFPRTGHVECCVLLCREDKK